MWYGEIRLTEKSPRFWMIILDVSGFQHAWCVWIQIVRDFVKIVWYHCTLSRQWNEQWLRYLEVLLYVSDMHRAHLCPLIQHDAATWLLQFFIHCHWLKHMLPFASSYAWSAFLLKMLALLRWPCSRCTHGVVEAALGLSRLLSNGQIGGASLRQ